LAQVTGKFLRIAIAGGEDAHDLALRLHVAGARPLPAPVGNRATSLAACLAERVAQGKIGMKSGEGFLKWTPEAIQAAKAEYERKLKAAFALL
jgi:3-hydroxybutyryl-CoA dehydrogenase